MTTSSEDVLLQMGEVRYKKGDGTLYVMNERIAWMVEHRDTVTVAHKFADIKMQKISPEGKPKIQLQVVLHDGNSSTFHFVNRNGLQAQLADRDKVKELLQQLLPNFRRKVDKDLEEKNRIFTENPALLQLYKDLVITQVLNSEEFWSTHAKEYKQKNTVKKQDIGVSGAFLADIKPQTDGCNGLKYNLTADIIHCIFKTYPAVKRKHQDNVPNKMTEQEFWTKFFQSHYFHRDRITAGTKDMFAECGKIDDQNMKNAVQTGPQNSLLNIKDFEDVPLEEGFCSVNGDKVVPNSGNIVHQNMIKRFNQHSIMVLNTCTESKPTPDTLQAAKQQALANKELDDSGKSPPKKRKIVDKIFYEDLGEPHVDLNEPLRVMNGKEVCNDKLNLTKVERYLHGPMNNTNMDTYEDLKDLEEVQFTIHADTESWSQRTSHKALVSVTAAVNALGELSPGGALMRGFQDQSLDRECFLIIFFKCNTIRIQYK
ncbi:GTF2H1 family protein [Megaselia abdita]